MTKQEMMIERFRSVDLAETRRIASEGPVSMSEFSPHWLMLNSWMQDNAPEIHETIMDDHSCIADWLGYHGGGEI